MNEALQNAGFLRLPAVLNRIPVSRSSWWNGVKTGKFPAPIKLGANTSAWRVEDINNLIAKLSEQNSANHTNLKD